MPDLTPVPMAACTASRGEYDVQGSTGTYVVTCDSRWDWSCTCPAFKYSKDGDWCKHINQIRAETCTWNQLLDGGSTDENGRCPECGGEVEYYTAMV